jgi:hypothetical protein
MMIAPDPRLAPRSTTGGTSVQSSRLWRSPASFVARGRLSLMKDDVVSGSVRHARNTREPRRRPSRVSRGCNPQEPHPRAPAIHRPRDSLEGRRERLGRHENLVAPLDASVQAAEHPDRSQGRRTHLAAPQCAAHALSNAATCGPLIKAFASMSAPKSDRMSSLTRACDGPRSRNGTRTLEATALIAPNVDRASSTRPRPFV